LGPELSDSTEIPTPLGDTGFQTETRRDGREASATPWTSPPSRRRPRNNALPRPGV